MRRLASNVSNNLRLIPQLFVSPLALLGTHDVNSDMNHKFANRMLWNLGTPLGVSFMRAPPNEPTNKRLKVLLFR